MSNQAPTLLHIPADVLATKVLPRLSYDDFVSLCATSAEWAAFFQRDKFSCSFVMPPLHVLSRNRLLRLMTLWKNRESVDLIPHQYWFESSAILEAGQSLEGSRCTKLRIAASHIHGFLPWGTVSVHELSAIPSGTLSLDLGSIARFDLPEGASQTRCWSSSLTPQYLIDLAARVPHLRELFFDTCSGPAFNMDCFSELESLAVGCDHYHAQVVSAPPRLRRLVCPPKLLSAFGDARFDQLEELVILPGGTADPNAPKPVLAAMSRLRELQCPSFLLPSILPPSLRVVRVTHGDVMTREQLAGLSLIDEVVVLRAHPSLLPFATPNQRLLPIHRASPPPNWCKGRTEYRAEARFVPVSLAHLGAPDADCAHCSMRIRSKCAEDHDLVCVGNTAPRVCCLCHGKFARQNYHAHMRTCPENVAVCRLCSRTVAVSAMPSHLQRAHHDLTDVCDLKTPMDCPNRPCTRLFSSRSALAAHLLRCLSAPTVCHSCRLEFPARAALLQHQCTGPSQVPGLISIHLHSVPADAASPHDVQACNASEACWDSKAKGWTCFHCSQLHIITPHSSWLDRNVCTACKRARCPVAK